MKKHLRVRIAIAVHVVAVCALLMVAVIAAPLHAAPVEMRVIRDIPYVTGPAADPRLQALDLYLPQGKTNFPLLFFVHGGGFTRGDKNPDGFNNFVDFFLREGIGVASTNYRLSPAVQHPAHVQDVAKAFAWIRSHAAEYQIDPNRIFIAGSSAGGYIVASLALNKKYLAQEGLSQQAFRGVITISGVYEGGGWERLSDWADVLAGVDTSALEPVTHLVGADQQLPPWLITYTDHDYYGMPEQGRRLYSLLVRHDLPVELAVVTDRAHVAQIGGVGRQLPAIPDPGVSPARPVLIDDTLGPAILRFVGDVLRGQPMPSAILKAKTPAMRTVKDLQYDTSAGADPELHSMDLYLPEGKTNFPMVFFIHGGAWRTGDKADANIKPLVETFARIGVGVASTNYRLSPASKHPSHIQDAAKAFAWLYENAAKYGIDRNRLFVAGHSAGAHLSALLALNQEYLKREGLSPSAIRGVLCLNGIYDIATFPEIGRIPTWHDEAFAGDRKVFEDASPMKYASRQAPPMLIAYAENDLFRIREQSISLYAALLRQGAKPQLAHIPSRTHGGTLAGMGQQADGIDDVMAPTAVEFVTRILAASSEVAQAR